MTRKTDWGKARVLALSILLLLFAAGTAWAAGGAIPREKWLDLLYRALNFAALVAILVFFLKKPVSSGLSNRREGIREQLEALELRKSEAERMYLEAEAKLDRLDEEVNGIIAEAVKQGEAEKSRILADAERAAADIRRQAEMAVAHEFNEARSILKAEIAEQAALLAEELIRKNIQAEDQNRMVAASLEKLGGIQ